MSIRNRAALLLHRLADRSRAAAIRLSPITFDGTGKLYIPHTIQVPPGRHDRIKSVRRPPAGGAGEAKAR